MQGVPFSEASCRSDPPEPLLASAHWASPRPCWTWRGGRWRRWWRGWWGPPGSWPARPRCSWPRTPCCSRSPSPGVPWARQPPPARGWRTRSTGAPPTPQPSTRGTWCCHQPPPPPRQSAVCNTCFSQDLHLCCLYIWIVNNIMYRLNLVKIWFSIKYIFDHLFHWKGIYYGQIYPKTCFGILFHLQNPGKQPERLIF